MSAQVAPAPAVAPVAPVAGVPGAPQPYISASLYVGDLHPEVIEATLYEAFSTIGHVASVRVCRDAITRRSLGYGYVNYHSFSDAERALELLNYTPLKERPMRIMWVQRDPSSRRSGPGNIFIKNLAKTIDIRTFSDTFSAYGNILSCKIALDEDGKSKGYGFIHYETAEMAATAMSKVNGMLLEGKKVSVVPFQSRRDREQNKSSQERPFTNLFVKELEAGTTLEQIKAAFGQYGEITSAAMPTKEDGSPKGFAFVCFKDAEKAKAALNDAANIVINGKTPYIARHQARDERSRLLKQQDEQYKQSHRQALGNLYIKNLDESIDDDKLRLAFANFGTITSSKIMRDEAGSSRGFGFVCFASADDATRAAQEMNGRMLAGKPLYVALHQRKEVRRAQLEAQYAQRLFRRMDPGMPGMYAPPQYMGYPPQGRQFYPMMPGRPAPAWRQPGPPYLQGPAAMPPQMAGLPGRGPRQVPPTGAPRIPKPQAGPLQGGAPAGVLPKQMGQPNVVNQRAPASNRPVQYTRNVRNQGQVPFTQIPGQEPLTPHVLAAASPAEQKNMLGERLYPLVYQQQGERAGKITGMLLEMDNSELLILLESPQELLSKISEAVAVLDAHTQASA
eukprot:TRINITY_DN33_c0_g1_i5.p1 TRINITY_DN33_c0_g1~~TRINITY_DN33_c0_g1_i5.p1  ORF type:complete len:620 (-),score=142.09 TRINITY_DN33_c0_g1_i5:76-1935(-)